MISENGDASHLPESITFAEQSQRWLQDLSTRKRKPISPATLRVFASYVRRLTPMLGEMQLADITNGTVKQLVQRLDDEKLSPKTINELVAVVKQVVSSAVDDDGMHLFPRTWSAKHIDAPTIAKQRQPCLNVQELEKSIKDSACDQERVLYCLLAGSGLRIAEALAIRVSGTEDQTSWIPDTGAIDIRSSIFNGREVPRLKTLAARRTVDLDSRLNDLIALCGDQRNTARRIHLPGTQWPTYAPQDCASAFGKARRRWIPCIPPLQDHATP